MTPIIGLNGLLIAKDYSRLVRGGRGDYLEIVDHQVIKSNIEIEPGQEYRLRPEWQDRAYYAWYRTTIGHYKLYFQYRLVTYADYKVGRWYIDPTLLKPQAWRIA